MTLPPGEMPPEEIMWEGRFIIAKRRGRWEYVGRPSGISAAVVVAIEDGHVLLVEEFRVPLGRFCLGFPAGLVGDDVAGEGVAAAAGRELIEETGWAAARIEVIGDFASSPGMVSETFTLVHATGLTRVGAGGGVDGEDITVHRVALAKIAQFVARKRDAGVVIDVKLLMLLGVSILRADPQTGDPP